MSPATHAVALYAPPGVMKPHAPSASCAGRRLPAEERMGAH